MGCTQSKIENEEAVIRCKERKQWMREAVAYRNAFAAAHSAFVVALKNTGAALSDYGQGELPHPEHHPSASASSFAAPAAAAATAIQPPVEKLQPPPPPHLDISLAPLQRSASMPDLPVPKLKKKPPADASIREEEGDEDEAAVADDDDLTPAAPAGSDASPAPPPPPPPPPPQPQRSTTPPPRSMPESKGFGPWEYIFDAEEHMPPPTLSQPDETWPPVERREIEEEKIKIPATPPPPPAASNDIHGGEPPVTSKKVVAEPLPSKPLKKLKQGSTAQHHHTASAGALESKKGKMVAATVPPLNLLQILNELDDHFLKASESAHEVSKMLEATRMHYHSNFADNRGHIDHSARVMKVITWNRSIKGIQNPDDEKDDFDNDEWETHATILDKMLAWEKKLYDEVKAGEYMKIEYQKKVASLNKLKKRDVGSEALEKAKSAVSHLHTRYIVDMQSMDSTVSEINRLRDDRLYPKLVDLVDGMANMWETMRFHHAFQQRIVANLRALDDSLAVKETSEQHYERTGQLWKIVREWHSQSEKVMKNQREYIKALNSWLKLNLIPIESNLKEKVSSPPRPSRPPIQALLQAWNDMIEKLPVELATSAIYSFAEVVHTIVVLQGDELKKKEKCEDMRKDFLRKKRAFEDWYRKYSEKKAALSEEANPEGGEGSTQDPVSERKFAVDALESRLKEEEEAYGTLCEQVRKKSLNSLKTHLPELFRAVSDFALACSEMYKKLRSVTQSLKGH